MLKMITGTPIYIWVLLGYLLYIGIKSSRHSIVPLKVLAIMPVAFTTWGIYSVFGRYGFSLLTMGGWGVAMVIGIAIGILLMRSVGLKFDQEQKLVEMPGTWMTLILSMSLFSTKYFLGMKYAMSPGINLFSIELVACTISGILLGRFLGILQRFRLNLEGAS